MTLREEQSKFALAVADLIQEAHKRGYEVTLGDAYRDPRLHGAVGEKKGYGHSRSCHKVRLAIDLNLFINGEYQTGATGHDELHDWWVSAKGGAPMIEGDFNHYSFKHGMMT